MSDEKKENIYTIEGELVSELDRSKSYFATRGAIEDKLLNFKTEIATPSKKKKEDKDETKEEDEPGEEILVFDDVGNVKIEGKKFTIPTKVNKKITKTNFSAIERARIIREVGEALEIYFGIGPKGETDSGGAQREADGIIDVEKFTSFDRKSFEA